MSEYKASKLKIWIALITVYIVWGSTYLAIRFGVETIPPFLLAGIRFLIAGSLLYGWRRLAKDPAPTWQEWRSAAMVGFFMLLAGNGLLTWAEQHVVSGIAALLVGSSPIWLVLIDAMLPGGRRPNLLTALGILTGIAGIALLIGRTGFNASEQAINPAGLVALLICSAMWSAGSILSREVKLPASPLLGISMEMLTGGVMLMILASIAGEWQKVELTQISTASLLGLAYLVIFGALIGYSAYLWLLRVAPIPLVSTYAFVNPLIAIFMGNLLAAEPLTLRILLATLVIISSVVLINRGRSGVKPAKQAVALAPSEGDG